MQNIWLYINQSGEFLTKETYSFENIFFSFQLFYILFSKTVIREWKPCFLLQHPLPVLEQCNEKGLDKLIRGQKKNYRKDPFSLVFLKALSIQSYNWMWTLNLGNNFSWVLNFSLLYQLKNENFQIKLLKR